LRFAANLVFHRKVFNGINPGRASNGPTLVAVEIYREYDEEVKIQYFHHQFFSTAFAQKLLGGRMVLGHSISAQLKICGGFVGTDAKPGRYLDASGFLHADRGLLSVRAMFNPFRFCRSEQ
jgi:hypothetical protein